MAGFEKSKFDKGTNPNLYRQPDVLVALQRLETVLREPSVADLVDDNSTRDVLITDVPKISLRRDSLTDSFTYGLCLPETFDITDIKIGFHQPIAANKKSVDSELGWFFGMEFTTDHSTFSFKADQQGCDITELDGYMETHTKKCASFVANDMLESILKALKIDPRLATLDPTTNSKKLGRDLETLLEKLERKCECKCNKFLYCPVLHSNDYGFMQLETSSDVTLDFDKEPKEQNAQKDFIVRRLTPCPHGIMSEECRWQYEEGALRCVVVERKAYATTQAIRLPIAKALYTEDLAAPADTVNQLATALYRTVH